MQKFALLKNSIAIALALALSLPAPQLAFAQETTTEPVDCEANPDSPACLELKPGETAPAEVPAGEAPATEEPAAEEPAAEQPAAEEPAPEQPAAEEPAAEQPAAEQPATEEPTAPAAEEPAAPAAEEPAAQEPAATEQPAAEQPAAEEPAAPAAEEPAAPAAEEPAPEQPATQEPAAAEQPAAEQPATEAPAAEEPAADAPVKLQAAPEQPAAEMINPETAAPAGEPVAVSEPEAPTLIVPDNVTDQQRATIQADEQQRRDDSRKRRGELLGAAAIGAAIGMLVPALGGKVVEDQGDRIIVERDGEYYVRKDESSLLREGDAEVTVQRLRGGLTREIVTRRDGVRIETVRDSGGYILRRSRVLPDGREYVIIDNGTRDDRSYVDYGRRLPPLRVDIPRDRYIVPARQADRDLIYRTFAAPPVEAVENAYTLREVRESERLRDKVRRVDLDTVTFESGSAVVRESQVQQLEELARAAQELIDHDPSSVLLVEGHTDAVGSEISNLALSDRRAETVAWILTSRYGVPPENLVVQGYGEQFLKINTQKAEQQNRRVTIRNITQLLSAGR